MGDPFIDIVQQSRLVAYSTAQSPHTAVLLYVVELSKPNYQIENSISLYISLIIRDFRHSIEAVGRSLRRSYSGVYTVPQVQSAGDQRLIMSKQGS